MGTDRPSNVGQLLTSAALQDAELLAGAAGRDAAVVDVILRTKVTRETPPQPGELVVLDAASIGEHPYEIDVALRVISDAAAVGLIVTNPGSEIGLGAQRLADRFALPLVVLAETDAMALTHRLRAQLWAPDVEQASVVSALLDTFGQMRLTTVDSVIESLEGLCGSSISVLGQDRGLVAGSAIEVGDRRLASEQAYLVDHSTRAALHSATIVLSPDEEPAYWLVAESVGSDSAQRLLRTLLQIGSWYLAALLASLRARAEGDARRRIAVLNEILDTSDLAERDIQNQMLALEWSVSGWNTGLHIKLRGADAGRVVALHFELRDRLRSVGLDGPLVERNDGWSGWLTNSTEPAVETFPTLVEALAEALQGLVLAHPGLQAHAGIGRPYADLVGLRLSLTEAHEASVIANARSGGASGAAHIDQLGVQRVLMGWFSSEEFARYARSILQPVLEADVNHELLRTLEVYLDASCSTTDAARQLGVHRNTVTNRIRRIVKLLGIAFDDPETRLSLQLACRVLRLNRQ